MNQFLEAGKIVNTHGINGELKIQVWCDSIEFFIDNIREIYIDGVKTEIISARKHKECALVKIDGLNNISEAEKLKNKIIFIDRDQVELPENAYFISDIIGFSVHDLRIGKTIGELHDVTTLPSSDIYVVKNEKSEILIPAVPEFIKEIDYENHIINVRTISGMGEPDEN